LINALTKIHGITVKAGNVVAQLMINHVQRRYRKSNKRSLRAIALRENVIYAANLKVEHEAAERKELQKTLKAAQRLINA